MLSWAWYVAFFFSRLSGPGWWSRHLLYPFKTELNFVSRIYACIIAT